MTLWHRDHRDDDESDLDQWIKGALDAELRQMNTRFDFQAGLADVYARAGLARPSPGQPATISSPSREDVNDYGPAQEVVDHIEMLDALLVAVSQADNNEASPLMGVIYLKSARQFLMQLRVGLTGRTLAKTRAVQLVGTIKHDLKEADKILRAQQGLSLQEAVHARIGELRDVGGDLIQQVERLHEKVLRLFSEADEPAPRIPVPH